jgi:ribosomal protein L34
MAICCLGFVSKVCVLSKVLCLVSDRHYTESGNCSVSDEEKGRRVLATRVSHRRKGRHALATCILHRRKGRQALAMCISHRRQREAIYVGAHLLFT